LPPSYGFDNSVINVVFAGIYIDGNDLALQLLFSDLGPDVQLVELFAFFGRTQTKLSDSFWAPYNLRFVTLVIAYSEFNLINSSGNLK